jgi:hypothetical protein
MSKPVAAMVSQGIVAASSLLLQVVASRRGAEGLGRFSLLVGVLITLNSVASGWIGDSLTVLDRFELGIRRALFHYQFLALVIAFAVGFGIGGVVDGVDRGTAIWFGAACALWGLEETGRRLLIARRQFWALVANDASYALGSFGYVFTVVGMGAEITIRHLVIALAVGALTAIVVAAGQLPDKELALPLTVPAKFREVASFAVWRSAQVGLRPGALAVARGVVSVVGGVAAVGQLEGARLVVAPVLTLANGAGVYLLPTYTHAVRERRPFRPKVPLAMGLLVVVCGLYGALAVVFLDPLSQLLTDGTYEVSVVAVVAWVAFSAGFAGGIPAGNAVVAQGRSRLAFWFRSIDALVGVAVASAFAVAHAYRLVPAGLAVGTAVGAMLLLGSIRRSPGATNGSALPVHEAMA